MPTPEKLTAQLAHFANPDGPNQLRERLQGLPPELAEVGLIFLEGCKTRWSYGPDDPQETQKKRSIELFSVGDRARVFGALFPNIAEHVEASWQLQKTLPYPIGYLRRAFRAPNNPEYTLHNRVEWLDSLLRAVQNYTYDLDFLAVWAARLVWGSEEAIGILLASVLNSNHPASGRTYTTLVQIVNGEHPIAVPARYAVTALLSSSNPDGWGVVERLLLAAQRQEGLRQVVLESVDFAHRDAFVRMLQLIHREKLSRFAAVTRALGVWFGLPIESEQTKSIDGLVFETLENLTSRETRGDRIRDAKGQSLYLALWADAFIDVTQATQSAAAILRDRDFERRYAAVHLLTQLGTVAAARALRDCLNDGDLRVAIKASEVFPTNSLWHLEIVDANEIFAALQALIVRVSEEQSLPPAVWEWNRIKAKRADVAAKMIAHRGERPFSEVVPYLSAMDADGRRTLLRAVKDAAEKRKSLQADERDLTLSLLGDPSNGVRQTAFEILGGATLTSCEAELIEPLLARKASDLRRGVIRILLKQSVADCRASIERLSSSADVLMKQAAEEIRSELEPKSERAASLEDGLGLFDPAERTNPVVPREVLSGKVSTPLGARLLRSLDELVDQHRETPITYKGHNGEEIRELFGNLLWLPPGGEYPLGPVWSQWWTAVRNELGADDLELVRTFCTAILLPEQHEPVWAKRTAEDLVARIDLKFPDLVRHILGYLVAEAHIEQGMGVLLDFIETYLCRLAQHYEPKVVPPHYAISWRTTPLYALTRVVESCRVRHPENWDKDLWRRYWLLLRWIDEGMPGEDRQLPSLKVTLAAHTIGVASDADVYEQLLGGRGQQRYGMFDLAGVTKRKPNKLFSSYPELAVFAGKCRERVLEVELARGDLPTAASPAALTIASVFGAELALRLLRLLGKDSLSRGYTTDNESRSVVFSHLLRVCLPADGDTPERFAECAKRVSISRKRLVDLALYAPQWAAHVEEATGIVGLEDAAYWLHAHTKDSQWTVDAEIRELWFAEVSERTPLPREELLEGAVDIDWFHRIRVLVSAQEWKQLFDSAKYASGGAGHKRAQLFAEAIAGEVATAELAARIIEKRSQDAVRAMGLVPLPDAEPERRQQILGRYELLQKFIRESKQFGALRQASEKLAAMIGLANLARTAGYADPQRLSWAMEAAAIADLKAGPVEAFDGEVKGILAINAAGEPELTFEKGGKVLKDLPASLKKSPALTALRARKTSLGQQTSRMRQSLEEAMIRGDRFTFEELAELTDHPLLRPMVGALLFTGESGEVRWYSDLGGANGSFRIAHPVDLLHSGEWPARQTECFGAERLQPFKQAFRELYVLTDTERGLKSHSGRYEGNQVNPKQGMALLGKRGWVNVPDEGVRKTFHHDNVSVWVTFLEGWFTPADVDGLTVQHVVFRGKSDGKVIPLDQVNCRIFSEAMRDLDLMVSVAHRGGVDPEATASTVEMRTALLRETVGLLKINNVRLKDQYAFVDGKIGNYNIHLGSGTVHRQPGGSVCIIPVHSQHRGRLFLPFADHDPKTAEIVSKVLLLAQDDKIKDPTILEQLR